MRPTLLAALPLIALLATSCKDDKKPEGSPPPPTATAPVAASGSAAPLANLCATGGGTLADAVLAPLFPRQSGATCIEPGADLKTYGEKAKLPLKQLCETALDGGCEEYMKFGVTRAAIFHYVQSQGGGSVEVLVSQFPGDAAYALLTTRLAGDLDPADPAMPKPIPGLDAGALGTGKAYLTKGPYFVELTYTNDAETPEQLAQTSASVLGSLAKDIASRLPDKPELPASARLIPQAERLGNGLVYYLKDALGVPGLGAGAMGFHKNGDTRYRTAALVRADADAAKDAIHTIGKRPGALPVSGLGDDAVQVVLQVAAGRPKIEFVFARKGTTILGVGDDDFAADRKASKDDKIARLRPMLAALKERVAP